MRTVQLRRYDLKPERVEAFLEWWPTILVPARAAYGFAVDVAFFDRAANEFTWTVSVEGDEAAFAAAEAEYLASPERAAAFEGVEPWTADAHIALVERLA